MIGQRADGDVERARAFLAYAAAALVCGVVFIVDLTTPRGLLASILYAAPVALAAQYGVRENWRVLPFVVTLMIIAGWAASPVVDPLPGWIPVVNRSVVVAGLWAVAIWINTRRGA